MSRPKPTALLGPSATGQRLVRVERRPAEHPTEDPLVPDERDMEWWLEPVEPGGLLRRAPPRAVPREEMLEAPVDDHEAHDLLLRAARAVEDNEGHERAKNTFLAYAKEWATFVKWCVARGQRPMPATPRLVQAYLADVSANARVRLTKTGKEVLMPPRRPAGLGVALAAIRWYHRKYRYRSPTDDTLVEEELDRIRRRFGTAKVRKSPVTVEHLERIAALLDAERRDPPGKTDLERRAAARRAVRDKALVLFGFAGAFRRSELADLGLGDVLLGGKGVDATVRKSKVDQHGEGFVKAIPIGRKGTCPREVMTAWLGASGIEDGPIFREIDRFDRLILNAGDEGLTGDAVALVVKQRVAQAGLDPSKFSGHSLRAGLITAAAEAGRDIYEIMQLTAHKNPATVIAYVRGAKRHEKSAARGLL